MTDRNLWGDVSPDDSAIPPVKILREQAEQLSQMTQWTLRGSVEVEGLGAEFTNTLVIEAPRIEGYRYEVLQIRYSTDGYPLRLRIGSIARDWIECADEAQFVSELRKVLSSDKTRRLISTLVAQVASS